MDLSLVSTLSEVTAAFAVVLSLLYLGRQVRQNTRALRSANATALQTEFRGLARTLYSRRETAEAVLNGMSGAPARSPADQLGAHAWFFDLLKMAELGHFHYRNGDLDTELWDASLRFYRTWFDSPGMRAYWAVRRSVFVPEFQRAMDGWLGGGMDLIRPDQLVKRAAATPTSADQADEPGFTSDKGQ